MSPTQEAEVCDALVSLGALDTEQGLHAEGVRTIQRVLHCSVGEARSALHDLRERKLIQETASRSDEPPDRASAPLFRWIQTK